MVSHPSLKKMFKLVQSQSWFAPDDVTSTPVTLQTDALLSQPSLQKTQHSSQTTCVTKEKILSIQVVTSSLTEPSVSSFQWKISLRTVSLLKSTSELLSEQKSPRFSRKRTVCASLSPLKSVEMVCSWSRSALPEQLQFQLFC